MVLPLHSPEFVKKRQIDWIKGVDAYIGYQKNANNIIRDEWDGTIYLLQIEIMMTITLKQTLQLIRNELMILIERWKNSERKMANWKKALNFQKNEIN